MLEATSLSMITLKDGLDTNPTTLLKQEMEEKTIKKDKPDLAKEGTQNHTR